MKYLITENQYNNTRKLIRKSISTVGLLGTINRFNLNLKALIKIFDGYEMPYLDCEDLFYLSSMLIENNEVKTNFIIDNFALSIESQGIGDMALFIISNLESGDSLEGYSTPYWDGDCILPIDFNYFNYRLKRPIKNIGGETIPQGQISTTDISTIYGKRWNIKSEFSSFSEIKDFLENEYPQQIEFYSSFVFDRLKERYNLK